MSLLYERPPAFPAATGAVPQEWGSGGFAYAVAPRPAAAPQLQTPGNQLEPVVELAQLSNGYRPIEKAFVGALTAVVEVGGAFKANGIEALAQLAAHRIVELARGTSQIAQETPGRQAAIEQVRRVVETVQDAEHSEDAKATLQLSLVGLLGGERRAGQEGVAKASLARLALRPHRRSLRQRVRRNFREKYEYTLTTDEGPLRYRTQA